MNQSSSITQSSKKLFIIAWVLGLIFYFIDYATRSAPSLMITDLAQNYNISKENLVSLIGTYYYTYSIFALIAGGMSGVYFFQKFSVGLVGVASPGSVFLLLLLSPLEDKLHVLFGIMISAGVTFVMAFLIIKKNDIAFDTSDLNGKLQV